MGCFHFLVTINNATTNTHVQVLCDLFLDLGAGYMGLVTSIKCTEVHTLFAYILVWMVYINKKFFQWNETQTLTLLAFLLLWWEANPADIVAFGLVSKLGAGEEIGPGGVHHPQHWFTALFCSLTERSTGQESMARRKEKVKISVFTTSWNNNEIKVGHQGHDIILIYIYYSQQLKFLQ